jgi:hypothetical protein
MEFRLCNFLALYLPKIPIDPSHYTFLPLYTITLPKQHLTALLKSKAGLLNLPYGAGNSGKIRSAFGQHEFQ